MLTGNLNELELVSLRDRNFELDRRLSTNEVCVFTNVQSGYRFIATSAMDVDTISDKILPISILDGMPEIADLVDVGDYYFSDEYKDFKFDSVVAYNKYGEIYKFMIRHCRPTVRFIAFKRTTLPPLRFDDIWV